MQGQLTRQVSESSKTYKSKFLGYTTSQQGVNSNDACSGPAKDKTHRLIKYPVDVVYAT